MAKTLTDVEMAAVVTAAVRKAAVIPDSDAYRDFIMDLADLIGKHLGANPGDIIDSDTGSSVACRFHVSDRVPDDGGVFSYYDKDVVWSHGQEVLR